MSKTWLFLIILVVGGAVVVGFFTDWNPITSLQQFISNPSSMLPWLGQAWQFIQQNLAGFIFGIGSMLTLAANAISKYKKNRQLVEQNLQNQVTEISTAYNKLEISKNELQTKFETSQTKFTNTVQKLGDQLADTQEDLRGATQDVKRLTDERTHWFQEAKKWEAKANEGIKVP